MIKSQSSNNIFKIKRKLKSNWLELIGTICIYVGIYERGCLLFVRQEDNKRSGEA